jgi:hypothetical protein
LDHSMNCPNCGAAVEYDERGRTMKCPYCGSSIEIPAELWQPVEEARSASRWKKYLVLFLIVTVGLPTCLGLLGTVLGIGGGIFAAIIPFVLRIFIH